MPFEIMIALTPGWRERESEREKECEEREKGE